MIGAAKTPDIAANVACVRERVARAAERAGRGPEEIRLIAVSKRFGPEAVRAAIAAGVSDIGENYVQEAAAKRGEVEEAARWHLVGHLQRNKAGKAAEIFDVVQTVDSTRLARALGRSAHEKSRTIEILLQVNTSGEEAKSGVAPDDAERLLTELAQVEGVRVRGLMTIGRWDPDPEKARPEFCLLARLAERLASATGAELKWLSMGMSNDLEVAIEEGANLVRVGTAIFGARPG
jgi:pyridoxal phosphate enzyme (YggS family)